jgi:DNA-binding transcriptional MerR regulator
MAIQSSRKRALESPTIPDRLYFKIGDVAKISGLETYVLRFWESQFPQLKPNKSGTGQRLYRRREVELVLEIKRLVHEEGYTLPGARQALEQQNRRPAVKEPRQESPQAARLSIATRSSAAPSPNLAAATAVIGHARAELREIAALLASPPAHQHRRRPRVAQLPNRTDLLFPS